MYIHLILLNLLLFIFNILHSAPGCLFSCSASYVPVWPERDPVTINLWLTKHHFCTQVLWRHVFLPPCKQLLFVCLQLQKKDFISSVPLCDQMMLQVACAWTPWNALITWPFMLVCWGNLEVRENGEEIAEMWYFGKQSQYENGERTYLLQQ